MSKEIATKMVTPKPGRPAPRVGGEDAEFFRRREQESAALAARQKPDGLGELLGANYYVTDYTWPFLMGPLGYQYSVTRYYPSIKVAVDIMTDVPEGRRKEFDFKRAACKKNGIRYGVLNHQMQPADVIAQVGL